MDKLPKPGSKYRLKNGHYLIVPPRSGMTRQIVAAVKTVVAEERRKKRKRK